MLKKRIIPCLDIHNGRTVKGINFERIKDAGDPIALAQKYSEDGADELVFLDISATLEGRKTMIELVRQIAEHIRIPFTVGGGVSSVEDAVRLIDAGADKIAVNTAALKNPLLIKDLAEQVGSQAVVLAIDSGLQAGHARVMSHGGQQATGRLTLDWVKEAVDLGAGEILLTSIDRDGTNKGFDLELLDRVTRLINIPVIASGGAGNREHFKDVFNETAATGALAASVFHYNTIHISALKSYLKNNLIPIR